MSSRDAEHIGQSTGSVMDSPITPLLPVTTFKSVLVVVDGGLLPEVKVDVTVAGASLLNATCICLCCSCLACLCSCSCECASMGVPNERSLRTSCDDDLTTATRDARPRERESNSFIVVVSSCIPLSMHPALAVSILLSFFLECEYAVWCNECARV